MREMGCRIQGILSDRPLVCPYVSLSFWARRPGPEGLWKNLWTRSHKLEGRAQRTWHWEPWPGGIVEDMALTRKSVLGGLNPIIYVFPLQLVLYLTWVSRDFAMGASHTTRSFFLRAVLESGGRMDSWQQVRQTNKIYPVCSDILPTVQLSRKYLFWRRTL